MTAVPSLDPARFLHEQLTNASPDLLRELLATFIDTLMNAEADAICGAEYGTRSPERTNVRNGYRHREFDTRVGTMDVAIPNAVPHLRGGADRDPRPVGSSTVLTPARSPTRRFAVAT